jgi:putative drug exporter of the RND superfamily
VFARWGRFVYRFRWATLVISAALLGISVVSLLQGGTLQSGGPLTSNLESFQAFRLLNKEFNNSTTQAATSTVDFIFKSDSMSVSDPAYKDAVTAALAPIQGDSRVVKITSPYNVPEQAAASLTSRDGHEALVFVEINSTGQKAWNDYAALHDQIKAATPSTLTVQGTGFVPINKAFNTTLESDLQRAEFVSLPITLLLLILIFATVVAAGLPLGVGLLTIVGGLGAMFFLNRFTDVSQYATNIVTLIGLGVSIDYSLFVVNRFRDELANGASREDAIAKTMATAGRAITFSGLTAAVGISAMLFYQGTFMASMGAAGAMVIGVAVLYGLTFLPAMLSVIGPAVNWRARSRRSQIVLWALTGLSVVAGGTAYVLGARTAAVSPLLVAALFALVAITGLVRRNVRPGNLTRGFWSALASWVMKRPVVVLVPTVAFLVIAATPFFSLRMANGNVDMLPSHLEARQGFDRLVADFPGQDQTTFNIVVNYPDGGPLTRDRIAAQYALDRRIAAIPGILHTTSIYDLDPKLGLYDYEQMYLGSTNQLPPGVQQMLAGHVAKHVVVITATSNAVDSSDEARNIVKAIRADQGVGDGGQVLVGGQTAVDIDVIKFIVDRTPLAVGIVVLVTYILLFLQTGSVVLPLKAVLLNFLSIGASFGALVFIFQQGHLASLFGNFTPQSLDPSIPVILFSIVFGLSMDYEVLLVSRIHEEYVRTGNNTLAVANGLERTGRLITGAAAIMFAVFMAFGLAEVVIIKAIGVGLAIAVAIDATIVRSLVVPAVMRLLGDVNWWAPRPLRWLHARIGLSDLGVEGEAGPVRRSEPIEEPAPEAAAV